jgi:prevent-host-death family protein
MLTKKQAVLARARNGAAPPHNVMVTTVEARDKLSDVINRAAYGKERIVLSRRNQALAAVVPIEDVLLLEALEDRIDLAAAKAALKEHGAIPWKDVKAKLGL